MNQLTEYAKLSMNYSVVNTIVSKKIDSKLSAHGISFSEFMILYNLNQADRKMMRRIDLAEKIGLSASGITRLVSPMEKIGLVEKETNTRDARVSLVKLSEAGERILEESYVGINAASQEVFSKLDEGNIGDMLNMLLALGGNIEV